ncbi:ribosomal protein L40E/Skp family chaperone for outer membrane proteins [Lachnospiraceae bacterium PM6-15]|uniref:YARHG domain-containing protein n=1 Tax=Ohessyouella blattaphilus TaxID=2949333 RepID=UPI003E2C036A
MTCEKCGYDNAAEAKFCEKCGSKLSVQKEEPKIEQKQCPKCGAENMIGSKFCEKCGNSFNQVPPPPQQNPIQQRNQRNIVLPTVIICTVLLLVCAAFLVVRYFDEKKQEVARIEEKLEEESKKAKAAEEELKAKEKEAEEALKEAEEKAEKAEKDKEAEKASTSDSAKSEYIISYSSQRLLTSSDLIGLSLKEINYAKNEIYARRGRIFQSKELSTYFNSKSWYRGVIQPGDFSESVLSEIEKKNAEFLSAEEFSRDANGYQLDVN